MREIYSIHCVTNVGDGDHATVGQKLNGVIVTKIAEYSFDGNFTYDALDADGHAVRSYINCPVVIDYYEKES